MTGRAYRWPLTAAQVAEVPLVRLARPAPSTGGVAAVPMPCACGCAAHEGRACPVRACGCRYYWPAVLGARDPGLLAGVSGVRGVA